ILELSRTFGHVDPIKEPIPVIPTCHYMMGGIPTNFHGQVINADESGNESIIEGFYAVGECACVSVHGANRLGGNSLLDLVVFGRSAGLHMETALKKELPMGDYSDSDLDQALSRYDRWESSESGEDPVVIRKDLQKIMQNHFGVFRKGDLMEEGNALLSEVEARLQSAHLSDKSNVFNTQRVECLELENLMQVA
ncbi:MAG: FAD-binding protein, partial [Bacteroidetes bacterium]|nr:FAD-binding protein [Bacteroidota bacterium]